MKHLKQAFLRRLCVLNIRFIHCKSKKFSATIYVNLIPVSANKGKMSFIKYCIEN